MVGSGGVLSTPSLTTLGFFSGGELLFDGGELENATIDGNAIPIVIQSAVFNNVSLAASLTMNTAGASLTIENGFNANGYGISAQSNDDVITFAGNGSAITLSKAAVDIGVSQSVISCSLTTDNMPGTSLIIAPSSTILAGITGYIGSTLGLNHCPSIINEGKIASSNISLAGGSPTVIIDPQSFTNSGTISSAGGRFQISPASKSSTNNGVLSMGANIDVMESLVLGDGSVVDDTLSYGFSGKVLQDSAGHLGITGNLDLGDDAVLNLSFTQGFQLLGPIEIASYTGTLTGTFAEVTPGFVLSYATPVEILVTAVPEPASVGLLAAAALLLSRRSQRRQP
jgi:hypothetical protein